MTLTRTGSEINGSVTKYLQDKLTMMLKTFMRSDSEINLPVPSIYNSPH